MGGPFDPLFLGRSRVKDNEDRPKFTVSLYKTKHVWHGMFSFSNYNRHNVVLAFKTSVPTTYVNISATI